MSEKFDIGPLSWVISEVDQSLDKVISLYGEAAEDITNTEYLRYTLTHLYQVNGAIDMVGLDGCKLYCDELQALTSSIQDGVITNTVDIMQTMTKAVKALSKYLHDVLSGMPDTPICLFDDLSSLAKLQGKSLDPSVLFYPETAVILPQGLKSNLVEAAKLPVFISEQRAIFQKALLDWLMHNDASALKLMHGAVVSVQETQQKKAHKSLWWAASAFIETLKQKQISGLSGAKKLCRKLDQQLRQMSMGELRIPQDLLRDVLYFVAISEPQSEKIAQVKTVFQLSSALPSDAKYAKQALLLSDAVRKAMKQLAVEIPLLKDLWLSVSENSRDETVDKLIPLEELRGVSIKLEFLAENMQRNGVDQTAEMNADIISLIKVTQNLTQKLLDQTITLNETHALEVATALNYLQNMAESYETLDDENHEKVTAQIKRIKKIIKTEHTVDDDHYETIKPDPLDDDVIKAVAEQVSEGLKEVEKTVDPFFRNPSNSECLTDAIRPLTQVVAAFDMLEMPTPKMIAKLSVLYVEQFKENAPLYAEPHPNTELFNTFAEGLSLLGLYTKDLPKVRTQSRLVLSECLQRLEHGLDILVIDQEEERDDYVADPLLDDVLSGNRSTDNLNIVDRPIVLLDEVSAQIATGPANNEVAQSIVEIEKYPDEEVQDKAIDKVLQDIFINEAQELLASNTENLKLLRTNSTNELAVTKIRRAFHTLKGSGRTVGLVMLGDVAHALEKLLNILLEHKLLPTQEVISFVQEANDAFERWLSQLNADQVVTLNAGKFQQKAATFSHEIAQALSQEKPKPRKEEVLIGGSRKVGRAFFYLFLGEAQLHLNTLLAARRALKLGGQQIPTPASRRAAHTLGSNALTAGFHDIGDLARALENWLDEFNGTWTEKQLGLYSRVIVALKEGLEQAKNLQHPKSTKSLIIELSRSTASMQVQAAQLIDEKKHGIKPQSGTGLSEQEILGSSLSEAEIADGQQRKPVRLKSVVSPIEKPAAPTIKQVDDSNIHTLDAPEFDHVSSKDLSKPETPENVSELPPPVVMQPSAEQLPDAQQPKLEKPKTKVLHHLIPVKPTLQDVEKIAPEAASKQVDMELLQLFTEEASELVPQIGRNLRQWKDNLSAPQYSDALQRDLHTLKGSARTAGQVEIGDRVHDLEDRILKLLNNKPVIDDFDAMFIEFDRISFMLEELLKDLASEDEQKQNDQITLDEAPSEGDDSQFKNEKDDQNESVELTSPFLRVRASMLDRLVNAAGEVSILRSRMDKEMHGFKQSTKDLTLSVSRLRTYLKELEVEADTQLQSRMTALKESNEAFDPLELDRFTRLQELTRLLSESLNDIYTIQQTLVGHIDQTDVALLQQNRLNRELQKGLMTVRMMPFSSIAERLHRIVRQVSRELDKPVALIIDGEDIELDRSVLDKMGAPLEHLLRNAVAHGLESKENREKAGKSAVGKISLKIAVEQDEITLTITDDGQGIDLDKVKDIAVKRGLLNKDQAINDENLVSVIFESGFTTEHNVSKFAGRGVGLDAVKSDIAALNGRIDLNNRPGAGVTFNIYLPVSLSVTQVVVVKVNGQKIALPSAMVVQVQTLKQAALLQAYEARNIIWEGQEYALHFLARLIGDDGYEAKTQAYTPVVLLRSGQYRTAIHVDEVVGNEEVVMKSLGTQLSRVPGIIGATVMSDGRIVYLMNPVQLAYRDALNVGAIKVTSFAPEESRKKVALIVDDSLTMRKALSRILEREGFDVLTANDGVDATQKLEDISPDIILTDIEMPRMDGYEFAKYVRENKATVSVPLVMVSSRTADKHKKIALDIGVDQFLGKPVQDDELVAVVNSLIAP